MKKAWRIEIGGDNCVVFAETAPKARWIAVNAYREAGYIGDNTWPPGVSVKRASMFDKSSCADLPARAWNPDFLLQE